MPNRHSPNHRLVALFALGILLLTYPFISLCNRVVMFLGVPLLYFYLFVVWAGLIVGITSITHHFDGPKATIAKHNKSRGLQ